VTEKKGPRLDSLKRFHPDREGYIHLQHDPMAGSSIEVGVKTMLPVEAAGYRGTFPVSFLDHLDNWIPELRDSLLEQLKLDSYASINTVYRKKPWPSTEDYKRINAAWVDCDCEDLDYFEALARVSDMTAKDLLLPFSAIERTGRGVRVYWLLKGGEDNPEWGPRSYSRNRRRLVQVNGALVQRMGETYPELEADAGAVYITTHMRVEGSINTRVGVEVDFTFNVANGNVPRYTLSQLADFLHLPNLRDTYRVRGQSGEIRQPKKRAGWVTRFEKPLQDFQLYRAYVEAQGGFEKGTRRHACYFLATLMNPCGYKPGEIWAEVQAVARRCNPPIPDHEARAQMKSANKRQRRPRNATVASKLGITREIAEDLDLQSLHPDHQASFPKGTKARREARHGFLLELAEAHGNPLPLTYLDLDIELKEAGHVVARGTIQNDLKTLGLKTALAHQKDTPVGPQQSLLN